MSIEMVSAVLALKGITPNEKLVLLCLAEHCRDGSPIASPGLDDDAEHPRVGMLRRTALGRTKLWKVTQGLLDTDRPGGALLRSVRRGQKHVRAEYELLVDPVAILTAEAARAEAARSARLLAQHPHSADADPDSQDSHSADADAAQRPRHESSASAPDLSASALRGRLPVDLPEQPPEQHAGDPLLVLPGDRTPASSESIADVLRVEYGVTWPAHDIDRVYRRIVAILGDDARASGEARGVLKQYASRPAHRRIHSIGAFFDRALSGDREVLQQPEVQAVLSNRSGWKAKRAAATDGATVRVDARAAWIDAHEFGTAARAEARATLADPSDAAVDAEARNLLNDAGWLAEQRPLGATA